MSNFLLMILFFMLSGCTGPGNRQLATSLEFASLLVSAAIYSYVRLLSKISKDPVNHNLDLVVVISCALIVILLSLFATPIIELEYRAYHESLAGFILVHGIEGFILSLPFILFSPILFYTLLPISHRKICSTIIMLFYYISVYSLYKVPNRDEMSIYSWTVFIFYPIGLFFVSMPVFIILWADFIKNNKKEKKILTTKDRL